MSGGDDLTSSSATKNLDRDPFRWNLSRHCTMPTRPADSATNEFMTSMTPKSITFCTTGEAGKQYPKMRGSHTATAIAHAADGRRVRCRADRLRQRMNYAEIVKS